MHSKVFYGQQGHLGYTLHCMSRVARIVVPGFPHHVTQRGNRRADIFLTDGDRESYLSYLHTYATKRGLSVWAYCLMTNHVHLIVSPESEQSLSEALHDAHTAYAMHFNGRMKQSGHVWQGRFYACTLDETHLWEAVRYVECNPVRAGMVQRAEDFPWSSAPAHCGVRAPHPVLAKGFPPDDAIDDWAEWLHEDFWDMSVWEHIRRQTHTGHPCGSKEFLDQLEGSLGRSVRPNKGGRPRKKRGV